MEARAFFWAIYTSCVHKMQTHTQAGWLFSRCLTPTPHAGGCFGVFSMRGVTGSPIEGNVQDNTARMAVEQREVCNLLLSGGTSRHSKPRLDTELPRNDTSGWVGPLEGTNLGHRMWKEIERDLTCGGGPFFPIPTPPTPPLDEARTCQANVKSGIFFCCGKFM